jgi:D-alanyl-lipoteichoic acid acyltransferase DltB (MBOAT superfamily)
MLFNSYPFLFVFLPIVVAIFWPLRALGHLAVANAFLAIASYVFYVQGEVRYPLLFLASIAFNYAVGRRIAVAEGASRSRWVAFGVIADLAVLGAFKYLNFLAAVLHLPPPRLSLPIGISFFTFTQIAYLVDVARRKADDHDPIRYGLFVTLFPHLIAGPILHHAEVMPQLRTRSDRGFAYSVATGLPLLAIGLFKKTVIADAAAPISSGLFARAHAGEALMLGPAWLAAVAYTAQIYFDFSGYSDMAVGLGRMLGIDLPVNFNSPYQATSIADFWRRWHITLSRFLRDYVYIPLGGNRRGRLRHHLNLFATMFIGGVWHGAGWTFMLWGALHGALLVLERAATALRERAGLPALPRPVARLLVLFLVMQAWIPFRAPDLTTAFAVWRGMFGWNGAAAQYVPVSALQISAVSLALLGSICLPNSQQWLASVHIGLDSPGYDALRPAPSLRGFELAPTVGWTLLLGIVLGLSVRAIGGSSEFIYFQF